MTDSEVPQGNQDGRINNSRHGYREMCDGATILKPNAFYMGSDGGKYYTCSKCGDPITDPIEYLEAKRKGNDMSAADLGHTEGTNTSQSIGSQDSIDTLKASIVEILDFNSDENTGGFSKDLRDYYENRIAEACLAWHNTQLKAAIPEKNDLRLMHEAEKNGTLNSDEKEILLLKEGYNQAIDDMQANFGQTEED